MITASDARKNYEEYHQMKWMTLEDVLKRIEELSKCGHNCLTLYQTDWHNSFNLDLIPELKKLGFWITKRYHWKLPFVNETEPYMIQIWWAKL